MNQRRRLDIETQIAKLLFYKAQARKDVYAKEEELATLKKNLASFDAEIDKLRAELGDPQESETT